jgi:hypothetical protein
VFQRAWGHTRTDRNGLIVNGAGDHLPWLTYPAIEYLSGLDLSQCRVFEFGAGSSTLFWAARCKKVVSVELDADWFKKILALAPPNVTLLHQPDGHRYARTIADIGGSFDIVCIDGAERYLSASESVRRLAPRGILLLDNSEWYPNTADMLASHGLLEIRFSGFAPLNAFTSTTSIFFTREFAGVPATPARQPPVGGRWLSPQALDDRDTAAPG